MGSYLLRLNRVHPQKISVCFTWDDNFPRHIHTIAPAFMKRDMRCTFYINPGEDDFMTKHLSGYLKLQNAGFEIGSHGFLHNNLCNLPLSASIDIVQKALFSIQSGFNHYPTTFAFPYHAFDAEILSMVKSFHLETRNTLGHSKRLGIKTDTSLKEMLTAVEDAIAGQHALVFSGHSIILYAEEALDECLKDDTGYNPILLDHLNSLLDFIQTKSKHLELLTFEQAALKEFICHNCEFTEGLFIITQEQIDWLSTFHIDAKRLSELM